MDRSLRSLTRAVVHRSVVSAAATMPTLACMNPVQAHHSARMFEFTTIWGSYGALSECIRSAGEDERESWLDVLNSDEINGLMAEPCE
jgi:hypothetical protein